MGALWAVLVLPFIAPWIAKIVFPHKIRFWEVATAMLVGVVISFAVFEAGKFNETRDYEIWNGSVQSKKRHHDSYVRSYSCNCRSVTRGSGKDAYTTTECDTCYEDRYTVDWYVYTTLGRYNFKSLDTTSKRVYKSPDPDDWLAVKAGDPVAQQRAFTNYVKAVPDSLFHQNKNVDPKYATSIPAYPLSIYQHYKINRVLTSGVTVPEIQKWNQALSEMLCTLGPRKEANVILVFTNDPTYDYHHALESKWLGGKKNDIIVITGVSQWPKIDWVTVSSWTDSQIFKVQLQDDLLKLGEADRDLYMETIKTHTMATFKRKSMKDFQYLESAIEPPFWVMCLAAALGVIFSFVVSFIFYKTRS